MMVNVIGLGYIGLPTALMLASSGIEVIGTDCKKELVRSLQAGRMTFKEDGLDRLFDEAVKGGIRFTTEYQSTDIYIISVPTPYDKFSKKVDASYVVDAVLAVMKTAPEGAAVVIESTISPGTIDKQIRPVVRNAGRLDIQLVHAPERIIPGNMVHELLHNNRTIGADSREAGEKIRQLYASFCRGEIVLTDIRTAEMTKVVENTYRAVNIAFANELAKICRHDNLDVYEIIRICNMHPRVNILQPGPGVGGHCISVDPWFLVGDYPHLAKVIDESMKTNDAMPDFILNRIYEIMKQEGIKEASRVGLYGLAYKANVDDMRESPTLQLLESQERHLAKGLKVYDPYICENVVENQYHDLDAFLDAVDMVVIMAGHDEIKNNKDKLNGKVVFDTRNIISGGKKEREGGKRAENIAVISYGDCEYDGRLRSLIDVLGHCGNLYCYTQGGAAINKNSRIFTGRSYLDFITGAVKYVKSVMRRSHINAVFLDNRKAAVPGMILKKKMPDAKFILDCRELYLMKDAKGFSGKLGCFFEQAMMKKADIVICANKERAGYMAERYGIRRPIVYENIRFLQYDDDHSEEVVEKKYAGYFLEKEIRIAATAGCSLDRLNDVLVRNLNRVWGKCRLFLIGESSPGDRKAIEDIIRQKHLKNVVVLGRLKQAELKYLLSRCHIGVVSYHQKDLNNRYCASGKLYEFLYEGLPVVTTTNPPLKRICNRYGIGEADDLFYSGLNCVIKDYESYKKRVESYVAMHPIRKTQEKLVSELCLELM